MQWNDPRILNRPIRLFWAGWETDTFRLGEQGWQISVEQDVMNRQMRIAINHPKARVQGITGIADFMYDEIMREGRSFNSLPVSLRFETLGHIVNVQTMHMQDDFMFQPVNHIPTMVNSKIEKLEDIAHFSTFAEIPKDTVFLHEANINQILEMALQKQEPEQERIRAELLREQNIKRYQLGTLHTELRLVA